MGYDYNKIRKQWEPIRFYWDGTKLWGIYPGDSKYGKKPHERRYTKGPVDPNDPSAISEKRTAFKMYHSSISPEKAWDLYPEYFI